MKNFWLSFLPLFVAVDAIGVLPMFLGLTADIEIRSRRRIIIQSVFTAGSTAALFVLGGGWFMRMIGITVSDFMIAGGLLLFVLSISDLLSVDKTQRKVDPDTVGAVPIGVPLITGPAVLTTTILLVGQHGVLPTLWAALTNVLIAGAVFWYAVPISTSLGSAGTKILSKIASLVLAAIGIMMIRKGIIQLISGLPS
jgi:multiple antibiotic resistance protein